MLGFGFGSDFQPKKVENDQQRVESLPVASSFEISRPHTASPTTKKQFSLLARLCDNKSPPCSPAKLATQRPLTEFSGSRKRKEDACITEEGISSPYKRRKLSEIALSDKVPTGTDTLDNWLAPVENHSQAKPKLHNALSDVQILDADPFPATTGSSTTVANIVPIASIAPITPITPALHTYSSLVRHGSETRSYSPNKKEVVNQHIDIGTEPSTCNVDEVATPGWRKTARAMMNTQEVDTPEVISLDDTTSDNDKPPASVSSDVQDISRSLSVEIVTTESVVSAIEMEVDNIVFNNELCFSWRGRPMHIDKEGVTLIPMIPVSFSFMTYNNIRSISLCETYPFVLCIESFSDGAKTAKISMGITKFGKPSTHALLLQALRHFGLPFQLMSEKERNDTRHVPTKKWQKIMPIDQSVVILRYPREDANPTILTVSDLKRLDPGQLLNDNIIEFVIRYTTDEILTPAERNEVYIFNTFFFSNLQKELERSSKWTEQIDWFSFRYLIIPVHYQVHWSLIVVCMDAEYFSEGRCALHLNSFSSSSISAIALIQRFLQKEWMRVNEKFNITEQQSFHDILWLTPELPQQPNGCDCGVYMLTFLQLFLKTRPRSITDFAKWWNLITTQCISQTRQDLQTLIRSLSDTSQLHKAESIGSESSCDCQIVDG